MNRKMQMLDRQRRMFRIAQDAERYGLTLGIIAADANLGYDSVRNYAAGETEMPMSAFVALIGVIPDALLSLLLTDSRMVVKAPDGVDHDLMASLILDWLATKAQANHPDSPAGRDISPCEDENLRGKAAALRAVA